MAAIPSRVRIVRFAMLLTIFVLTAFLYTSYASYSQAGLALPQRVHIVSSANGGTADSFAASAAALLLGGTNDLEAEPSSGGVRLRGSAAMDAAEGQQLQQQQQQQQQQVDDLRSPSLMQSDSENVNGTQPQTFADVSLVAASGSGGAGAIVGGGHNASAAKLTSALMPAAAVSGPQKNITGQKSAAPIASAPAAVAAVAAAQKPTAAAAVVQHAGNLDTLKGVRTSALYEPGHTADGDIAALCPDGGSALRLMILITSAPTHAEARLAIRQTWGSYATRRDIGIAFILGSTQQQPAVEQQLESENYMYGDVIRGHFLDSYNNLTLKTISSLEWIDANCPRVPFFLKTDDDMFINVPKLMAFMDKHAAERNVIYGRLAKKWKPIRNKKSKYYVSPQQYFPPVFPAFTTGPAYLMSTDVVHGLYAKALNQTYLKLEDVFTTGIVAQLVNVKRVHVNEFLNRRIAFNPCNIRRVISVHMVKSNEQFDLWKKLLDTGTKCK